MARFSTLIPLTFFTYLLNVSSVEAQFNKTNPDCDIYCYASCTYAFPDQPEFSACIKAHDECQCFSEMSLRNPSIRVFMYLSILLIALCCAWCSRKCISRVDCNVLSSVTKSSKMDVSNAQRTNANVCIPNSSESSNAIVSPNPSRRVPTEDVEPSPPYNTFVSDMTSPKQLEES